MTITRAELQQVMPHAGTKLDAFLSPINDAMATYDISTPLRIAAFLAQAAHESGELQFTQELASGKEYDGRKCLGNDDLDGQEDGVAFKGRGLLQVTGRNNYRDCSMALFGDFRLFEQPQMLEEPRWACMSAGWFWSVNKLNQLADQQDMRGITKRINGGYNGMESRLTYYKAALDAMGQQL